MRQVQKTGFKVEKDKNLIARKRVMEVYRKMQRFFPQEHKKLSSEINALLKEMMKPA